VPPAEVGLAPWSAAGHPASLSGLPSKAPEPCKVFKVFGGRRSIQTSLLSRYLEQVVNLDSGINRRGVVNEMKVPFEASNAGQGGPKEIVEGRPLTMENPEQPSTCRLRAPWTRPAGSAHKGPENRAFGRWPYRSPLTEHHTL
jgi:hypothetical protein